MNTNNHDILKEQILYYKERAPEYDEWFFRKGRYDRGEEHTRKWFSEVAVVEQALMKAQPGGYILDLATGTGIWAEKLAPFAGKLTVVDASLETMAICRRRLKGYRTEYIQQDIYQFTPQTSFDFIFFGFWLSHVPFEKFNAFWDRVRSWLRPHGKIFFVDSAFNPESSAKDHHLPHESGIVERKLNNGRTFRIVKMFYEPRVLYQRLVDLGWSGFVRSSGEFFIFGCLTIG